MYINYFINIVACIFAYYAMKAYIYLYTKRKITGQTISSFVPLHAGKQGTPTALGIVCLMGVMCIACYCWIFADIKINSVIIGFVSFGLIGLIDDISKIRFKTKYLNNTVQRIFSISLLLISACVWQFANVWFVCVSFISALIIAYNITYTRGLSSLTKLCLQFLACTITLQSYPMDQIILPFWNTDNPLILYMWGYFFILGVSNAVNISDGLDGLISLPLAIILLMCSVFDNNITIQSLLIFLPGFIILNKNPAKAFFGDVGSLSYGAAIAIIFLQYPLLLIIAGWLFLIEIMSIVLQILSIKIRNKRLFKMTPIHHHFEALGYSEKQIVYTVWIVYIVLYMLFVSACYYLPFVHRFLLQVNMI